MSKTNNLWLDRTVAAVGPYLTLVLSEDEYFKALKDCKIKITASEWCPFLGRTHILENNKGEEVCIVALKPSTTLDPIEIACILVHEAVHVWQVHCKSIGETSPGEEQEAYAIQNISARLMREYVRRINVQPKLSAS